MNKLLSISVLTLLTTVAYNQTDTTHQLRNSQNQLTIKIDSVHSEFELTPSELASFEVINDILAGEADQETIHLISYDMFQQIEGARSHEEDIIITYQNYTILVYRKSLEQGVKQ